MIRPYWADQTMLTGHRVGDAIDVVDSDKEYNVSVDVSQFEPEELKVNIVDNQLIIEGKHAEKTDKYGQVSERRDQKYTGQTLNFVGFQKSTYFINSSSGIFGEDYYSAYILSKYYFQIAFSQKSRISHF